MDQSMQAVTTLVYVHASLNLSVTSALTVPQAMLVPTVINVPLGILDTQIAKVS